VRSLAALLICAEALTPCVDRLVAGTNTASAERELVRRYARDTYCNRFQHPGAWVDVVEGAGHFIWVEAPGAVRASLRRLTAANLSENRSLQRSRRRAPANRARRDERRT